MLHRLFIVNIYLAPLGLFGRDAPAAIGRDVAAALDRLGREKAKAGCRAADMGRA